MAEIACRWEEISMSTESPRRLFFPAAQQVGIESFEPPAVAEGEVRVRTEYSLMSTGTENIVFNRLFDPGTHWDSWVKYPFYPGYCVVGTVEESRSNEFAIGDRVALRSGHQSHSVVPAAKCTRIPDGVAFQDALWFALAKIAFHGALVADHYLGDTVLVIGAGPIGQMAIRWARAAGAKTIISVDSAEERLKLAAKGGATTTIASGIAAAKEEILKANGGELTRLVIDTTGNAVVFSQALELVKSFGKLVLLGDTGKPSDQRLTLDVITRGLTIVGAHDMHETEQWNARSITGLFLSLVADKRFSLTDLITHTFQPGECVEAYAAANRDRAKTMGIIFDWRAA
ncbi:2-desacetyl-2-hydroxyethyl bacteriochlorophyllide A dehydrogenase [Terrimicrobium sacchariphilum]|uniref:2-desacetyl-2-hydroxyethyl bacteriochlorophyllide A dehydrogenase n=2 Tax=Terrimicrobium sacchariphilum TaxID=690879 RepID=A0A146GD97_TERSA|nr:2-desacetyl-2-hydroxyethyl bacteriochlorophyllide A dehydrogenase [Terrimicrobium sacchariphilum]